nr:Phosphoenolpyruvate carboxylase [Candidatus Pantoea persica]
MARAFSQFLNLTNVAEQYQTISRSGEGANHPELLKRTFERLKQQPDVSESAICEAIESLSLELVLTAQPTEITRRTLIHKLVKVNSCLKQLDHSGVSDYERNQILRRLRKLVAQAWHTDKIRKYRPTPIDEAKWGFAVVENSLWEGVPAFLRELNEQVEAAFGITLPVDFIPVIFTSWMGGDRDGNPNVTATITRHAMQLSRWKAADLFLRNIGVLISELSMSECSDEVRELCGDPEAIEPYRMILKRMRSQLLTTQAWLERRLKGEQLPRPADLLVSTISSGRRSTPFISRCSSAMWALLPTASCWIRCAA